MRDVSPPSDPPGDGQSDVPGARRAARLRGRPAAARDQSTYAPRHLRSNGASGHEPSGHLRPGDGPATGAEAGGDRDDGVKDDGAENDEERKPRRLRRTILEWAGVIGGGVVIALLVEAFFIQAFWIPSESMESTLEIGDRVLVNKLSYRLHDVHRGDVIVFERPPNAPEGAEADGEEVKDLIKRVIAVEGDTIEGKDGKVFVNGTELDESSYLETGTPTDNLDRQEIPSDTVFVMGDNRTNSQDSRIFGPIDEDDIVGRAFIKVLPIIDLGWL